MKKSVLFSGLLLFAVANCMAFFLRGYFVRHLESDAFVWQTKLGNSQFPRARVLAIGDSQIMAAVRSPEEGAFYNMGLPSAQLDTVRIILEKSAAQTVLLNLSPYMFFKSPVTATHDRLRIQQLQPEMLTLKRTRPGQMLAEAVYFLPIMGARPWARLCLVRGDCSAYLKRASFNSRVLSLLEKNQGQWVWQTSAEDCQTLSGPAHSIILMPDLKKGAPEEWQRLAAELKRKNTKVILLKIPFSPAFRRQGGSSLILSLEEILKRPPFATLYNHALVLGPPPELLGEEHFRDLTHLNSCGARIYSDWLWKSLER